MKHTDIYSKHLREVSLDFVSFHNVYIIAGILNMFSYHKFS